MTRTSQRHVVGAKKWRSVGDSIEMHAAFEMHAAYMSFTFVVTADKDWDR